MKKSIFFILSLIILLGLGCHNKQANDTPFVYIKNGQFIKNEKPYYYVGTNFWYGAILGSQGEGGDRSRLIKELDSLSAIGIDNLRILVGADGIDGVVAKVEPTLQKAPGVYNDTILDGLDFLISEMGKRNMSAILYLNNSWEWSGGYGQYLEWSGYGKAPIPAVDGWDAFGKFVEQYQQCDSCKVLFAKHVEYIVTRTNRYTNELYVNDPTIMSWQIGNEPRPFGAENKEAFAIWIKDVASQIRSLDKNHLISIGSEGKNGCEVDIQLWELIHSYAEVDYATIHIWPYNWGWANKDNLAGTIEYSKEQTMKYIDEHLSVMEKYSKPLVIEEFGFVRDDFKFEKGTPTIYRNEYLKSVFTEVVSHSQSKGLLAGCNFWAWGGFAEQNKEHLFWQKGDDYMGDPAQEQQGLYSVFFSDTSTVDLIRQANEEINIHIQICK